MFALKPWGITLAIGAALSGSLAQAETLNCHFEESVTFVGDEKAMRTRQPSDRGLQDPVRFALEDTEKSFNIASKFLKSPFSHGGPITVTASRSKISLMQMWIGNPYYAQSFGDGKLLSLMFSGPVDPRYVGHKTKEEIDSVTALLRCEIEK